MTEATALFDEDVSRIVEDLTKRFSLNGGRMPDSIEDFWHAIGSALQVSVPRASPVEMAHVVLERLGEEWDPDFEDAGIPSLLAYETLIDGIRSHGEEEGEGPDDEDDDATGDLAKELQIIVVGQEAPIQTFVQWVRDGTLVLDPDWQRGYVWRGSKKRRFIESIFLNLPIPPVLLFQAKDGKLYVIDGRQRLETVYRYHLGNSNKQLSFTTFGHKTPGWKETEPLHAAAGKRYDRLPADFQRKFNTFIIPARIFHNLPRRKLYEVFKRYNTGGDKLRPAEIRNAVYQGNRVHEMLYRLAGEHTTDRFIDEAERSAARKLRSMMKGKVARYGAYNFVGRFLAFLHMKSGSVAAATNEFMDEYGEGDPEVLRQEFLSAFNKTIEWYDTPLAVAMPNNKAPFHEWVATIQMVSTSTMLGHIAAGRVSEDQVTRAIAQRWSTFVGGTYDDRTGDHTGGVLQDKQNATTHWDRQRAWIRLLEADCGLAVGAENE